MSAPTNCWIKKCRSHAIGGWLFLQDAVWVRCWPCVLQHIIYKSRKAIGHNFVIQELFDKGNIINHGCCCRLSDDRKTTGSSTVARGSFYSPCSSRIVLSTCEMKYVVIFYWAGEHFSSKASEKTTSTKFYLIFKLSLDSIFSLFCGHHTTHVYRMCIKWVARTQAPGLG